VNIFIGDRHECKSYNSLQICGKSMAVVTGGPLHIGRGDKKATSTEAVVNMDPFT